jgi:DNA-binding Xre family transcriptional regulator
MIEKQRKHERRREVEAIKKLERANPGRGVPLRGLWACRMAAGLSQRGLAARVGTSQGTIHSLESLSRGAYPKTVSRLCEALEVEPADLLCAKATGQE